MDLDNRLLKQLPIETRAIARSCVKNKDQVANRTKIKAKPKINAGSQREEFVQKVSQKIAMINQKIDNEVSALTKTIDKMETDKAERLSWIAEKNYHGRPKFSTNYNPKETARIQAFQIKREEKISKLLSTSAQNEESLKNMKTRINKTLTVSKHRCTKADLTPHVRHEIKEIYDEGLRKIERESEQMRHDYDIDLNTDPNYQDLDQEDLNLIEQEFQCRLKKMETRMMKEISSQIDHHIVSNLPAHHLQSQKSTREKKINYMFDNGREIEFNMEELELIRDTKNMNTQLYVELSKNLEIEADIMRSTFESRVQEFIKDGNSLPEINQARMENEKNIKINMSISIRNFSEEAVSRTKAAEVKAIELMYNRIENVDLLPEIDSLVLAARQAFAEINAQLLPQIRKDSDEKAKNEVCSVIWSNFEKHALNLVEEIICYERDWNFFVEWLGEKWREVRTIEAPYLPSEITYLESMEKCLKIVRSCAIIYHAKRLEKVKGCNQLQIVERVQPVEVKMDPRVFKLREQCKKLLEEIQELDAGIIELRRHKSIEVIRKVEQVPMEYVPMEPVPPHLQRKIELAREKYRKPSDPDPTIRHAARPFSMSRVPQRKTLTSYKKHYQEDLEYQKQQDRNVFLEDLKNCPPLFS